MTTLRSRRAVGAIGAMALVLTIGAGTVAAAGPHGGTGNASAAVPARSLSSGQHARTAPVGTIPLGTMSSVGSTALARMADEEKLAQDLYAAFAGMYPSAIFDTIGAAESTHLAAIRAMLARYGIADPTAGMVPGAFALPETASLYSTLLAQGSVSESAALAVGRTVELDDIAKLDAARAGVTATDVARVYDNIRRGSTQHLAAFSRMLGR